MKWAKRQGNGIERFNAGGGWVLLVGGGGIGCTGSIL